MKACFPSNQCTVPENIKLLQEKDGKITASFIYGWIGLKGRDDLAGLIWKEGEVLTSGKTLIKKIKELYRPSDNYMKYGRKLSLLTQGTKAFKAFYSVLRTYTNYVRWKKISGVKNMVAVLNARTGTTSAT